MKRQKSETKILMTIIQTRALTAREARIHKCKNDEIPVKIQMRRIILSVILSKCLGKISLMKIWTA